MEAAGEELLESTEKLIQSLATQTRDIESLALLASLSKEDVNATLIGIDQRLCGLELATSELLRNLDMDLAASENTLTFRDRWSSLSTRFKRLDDFLALKEPFSHPNKDNEKPPIFAQTHSVQEVPVTQSNNHPSSMSLPSRENFDLIPRYIRSRVSYEDLVEIVKLINTVLERKRKLLQTKEQRNLDPQTRKNFEEYCAQSKLMGDSTSFVSERDLLTQDAVPNNVTLRTCLQCLRHLGYTKLTPLPPNNDIHAIVR